MEGEYREHLQERLTYMQVYKHSQKTAILEKYREDPRVQFFNQCIHIDKELFLPVLEYVHDKTLCL